LAVVFLYKALKLISSHKIALIFSLLLAVYPNAISVLPILYTEAFTGLLISSLIYCLSLYYKKGDRKYSLLAGFVLGYLTLTKVILGYVLIVGITVCLILLLFKKNRVYALQSLKILLLAFAVTVPYLAYTYHLTGKALYWGNSGGMSLYWMSTPYENEYGDWKLPYLTNNQYPILFKSAEVVAILKKNHAQELNFILKHNEFEQDELFKQAAVKNIKKNPFKFARNYYYNFSRMLFNFPYSYSYQDAAIVGNIIRGSLILWASVIGIVLTWLNRRRMIYPISFMLLITGVYLLLSGALSAYPRQLDVMAPVLLFWLGFLAANMPKLRLKFPPEENLDTINLTELAEIDIRTQEPV
jgi:4-amino-4-deoxy-L-arabinose transferase-like glycosyltransferase